MSEHGIQAVVTSAAVAREHVTELEAERALAMRYGLADVDAYMRDLEVELDTWREVYVTAAITEIASLRAELHGCTLG